MSTDNLDQLTDAELSEVFAVEVAGWTFQTFPNGTCPNVKHWSKPDGTITSIYTHGNFTTAATASAPPENIHEQNLAHFLASFSRKDRPPLCAVWVEAGRGNSAT
jgi:hypothetical protein